MSSSRNSAAAWRASGKGQRFAFFPPGCRSQESLVQHMAGLHMRGVLCTHAKKKKKKGAPEGQIVHTFGSSSSLMLCWPNLGIECGNLKGTLQWLVSVSPRKRDGRLALCGDVSRNPFAFL